MFGSNPLTRIAKVATAIVKGCINDVIIDVQGPHDLLHEQDGIRRRMASWPGRFCLSEDVLQNRESWVDTEENG